jgi:hypothetical protein
MSRVTYTNGLAALEARLRAAAAAAVEAGALQMRDEIRNQVDHLGHGRTYPSNTGMGEHTAAGLTGGLSGQAEAAATDTGALIESISVFHDTNAMIAGLGSSDAVVEVGTEYQGWDGNDPNAAVDLEIMGMGPNSPPRPFIEPAFVLHGNDVVKTMANEFADTFNQVGS